MTSFPNITCPICQGSTAPFGIAQYRTKNGFIPTFIGQCKSCDIFVRNVDSVTMLDHYHAAGYVLTENENKYLFARKDFFYWLINIFKLLKGSDRYRDLKIIDYGSSYGHFLQIAKESNIKPIGIEINRDLQNITIERGFEIYDAFSKVNDTVDGIFMVDSLYCVDSPVALLQDAFSILNDDGLLVLRITNRNWLAKIRKKLFGLSNLELLGDATISYSMKGILRLLNDTGFKIKRIIYFERGKKMNIAKKIIYALFAFITELTFRKLVITPGIVIFAEKLRKR